MYSFRFDVESEKWGLDIDILKEPAIKQCLIGWTENWEKENTNILV